MSTPYTTQGRHAAGGMWPQGTPYDAAPSDLTETPRLPTSVAGYEAGLAEARALLLEVLRSTKAYRGCKSTRTNGRYNGGVARYTAIEITDDLYRRIALALA